MSVISDNESFQSNDEIHDTTIGINITEYYISGSGNDFNDHRFICEVKCEGLTFYVDRNYIDFVELDRRIRKTYPKSKIDSLPLDGYNMLNKLIKDRDIVVKRRSSLGIATNNRRESITNNSNLINTNEQDMIINRKGSNVENEALALKIKELNLYLRALLSHHELVASEELLLFVDEEATSMGIDPSSLHPLSVHDILLLNEIPIKLKVSKCETITFNAPPGHLIIWRFSTEKYDIGFSVEMDDDVKVAYTRYKSNIRPICGTLEVTQPSVCKVKFDNSYAKLHSKMVIYTIRVVEMHEFNSARDQALNVQREKKKFELQRHALKRCACKHGALLSGVYHSSSIVHDHAAEQTEHVNDMENEIQSLKKLIDTYQNDFENIEIQNQELEQSHTAMSDAKDKITESWRFAINQLDTCRNDLKNMKNNNHELNIKNKEIEQLNIKNKDEIDLLKYEKNELDMNLNEMKYTYDTNIIDLKNEISNLTNVLEMNEILKNEEMKRSVLKNEEDIKNINLKYENEMKQKDIYFEELINTMKIEVEEQFNSMNTYIEEIEHKNETLTNELSEVNQTVQEQNQQILILNKQLIEKQDKENSLIQENINIQKQLEEALITIKQLDTEKETLQKKCTIHDEHLEAFREKESEISQCVSQVVGPMEMLIKTISTSTPTSPVKKNKKQENVIFDDIPELFPDAAKPNTNNTTDTTMYSDMISNNTKIKVSNSIPFQEKTKQSETAKYRNDIHSSLSLFKLGSGRNTKK